MPYRTSTNLGHQFLQSLRFLLLYSVPDFGETRLQFQVVLFLLADDECVDRGHLWENFSVLLSDAMPCIEIKTCP